MSRLQAEFVLSLLQSTLIKRSKQQFRLISFINFVIVKIINLQKKFNIMLNKLNINLNQFNSVISDYSKHGGWSNCSQTKGCWFDSSSYYIRPILLSISLYKSEKRFCLFTSAVCNCGCLLSLSVREKSTTCVCLMTLPSLLAGETIPM